MSRCIETATAVRHSLGSKSQLRLQPGRRPLPRVALTPEAVAVVEECPHVDSVEILLLVLVLEIVIDVSQVEIEPVALGRRVDPIEIAEALRVDE